MTSLWPPYDHSMTSPCPPYALAQVFVAWPQCWWSGADGSSLLGAQHTLLVGSVRGRWPLLTIVSDGRAAPRRTAEEAVLCAAAIGEEALRSREDGAPRSQQAVLCATAVGEEARRVESLPESP